MASCETFERRSAEIIFKSRDDFIFYFLTVVSCVLEVVIIPRRDKKIFWIFFYIFIFF